MSSVCTRMWPVCHSYVLVYHPYVTRMYSYVTDMSLACARMSPVCHSYVLVCHPCVTRMYSYVIHMSLVCGFTMDPLRVNNLRIRTIKNAKLSRYYFYMNFNIWEDFQTCISVPLTRYRHARLR